MSSAEKLCMNCLALCKVPKSCQKKEIEAYIKENFKLDGQLLDAEEIPGIEADESVTRWVVLMESAEDVQNLIHKGQVTFTYEGSCHQVIFQKSIPCEIPERWEDHKFPKRKPPVPQKRANSRMNVQHLLPQNAGQYGMHSGFYENVPRDPTLGGTAMPTQQTSQTPSQSTGLHTDQGVASDPSQQQFTRGGYDNPPAPPYPHPYYGYPPNFDHNQQNLHGDQGQSNMPQDHQGYTQGHPQGQQGFQAGQQFFPHGPPNIPYPGMMWYTDPKTGMNYMAPMSGYPNQQNQTGPDGRPNVPSGHPQEPPPPYPDQKFGFPSENTSEKETSHNSPIDPVVASVAIDDQKLTEAKIYASQGTVGQKSDEDFGEEEEKSNDELTELSSKLLVTNLPSTAHDEFIELFFASKKRFGGLEVLNVDYEEENASAIVEFESPEDVDVVLEKQPIKMQNQIVEVSRYEPEPEEPINPCVLQVSGPEDVVKDLETLEMYFENFKKSGGGDIDNIRYDEDLNLVIVTFEEEEAAQRVLERPQHTVKKQTLIVEQYIPRKKTTFQRRDSASDEEIYEDADEVIKDTIKVLGVTASIRSTVELYFENTRRSGGGDIVEILTDNEEEDVIYVKFQEVEVAERVLEREKHAVKGINLTVEQFIPVKDTVSKPKTEEQKVNEDEEEEEPIFDTVKVSGVDPSKRSTIELYFENARRSDGGEYEKIWSDDEEEGVIYIKYLSEEVAKKVAGRSHTVQGNELKASLYSPPKPPPSYDNKVIIKGLNESTSQDGLFNFIEAKSGYIPETMDYHETETDVVMVTFSDTPDFDKLEQIFQRFKLEGNTLKIAPVPLSNCIMVSNLPEKITQDTIQFYFENKRRGGGGDVQKVTMNDDDTCLVYFVDYTVIDNVLERKHTLSGQTIIVQRYQECLGRPEGDVKERKLKIPEPIVMRELDKNKIKYLKNSESNKNELERLLKDCHSKVCWPGESEDMVIECTITQSVEGCFKLVKTWKKDVMEVVENYFGNILAEKFDVLQDAWEKVVKKLQEISIANPECLALFIDKRTHLITIVGANAAVVELKKKIETILKDVMDEMERERQKVKEVVDNLKIIETKMLLANKFPDKMQNKLSIQVKINANKNEIVFEGPSGGVRDAKLAMHEEKSSFSYKKFENVPKLSAQLYMLKQTKEYIVKQLKAKRVVSVWEVDRNVLTVCSSEDHIDESFDIVKKSVTHNFIALKKAQTSLVNSEKWSSKILELQNSNQGKCVIEVSDDFSKILVSCTDDINQETEDSIRKFFRLNAVFTEKVTCTKNAHRLISKHHNGEVENIAKNLQQYNVQITSSDKYGGFEVKGTEDGIKKAKKKLEELLNKVKKEEHSVDKPGLGEFMFTPKGRDMVNTVEQSCKVVVSHDDHDDDDDEDFDGRESSMSGIEIFAKSDLYGCREVICGKGDMTEMDVEVLVNSANEKMSFSGGLGKVILKKGGKSIEKECKDYLKSANRLADGEAFISGAGSLKASYIIHIRGPVWNGGANNEEDMLEEAVFKCMQKASSKGATSIAMPAISCGAYGYPVQRAAETIVGAVKNYFREDQDSNVQTVYLCDVKSETAAAFSAATVKEIGPSVQVMQKSTPQPAKHQPRKDFSSRYEDSDDESSSYRGRKKPSGATRGLPSRSGHSDDSVTINNVKVTVVKAEIAREKVDMIVNTTAKNLDLKNGAVSLSLLKAGGDGLQDEINTNYPKGIKDGEIATTTGHKLKCQVVVHTSLTNYDSKNPGKSKAALRRLVINCLNEAEKQGVSSIAFPAIGTGNLGYPKDVVASEMFQSVLNVTFSSVTDVRFIVYQKDLPTIKAFTSELTRRQSPGGASAAGRYNRYDDDDDDDYSGNDTDDELRAVPDHFGSSDTCLIKITVKQGDITKERADCIVNSSNEDLDLSRGAVSKTLLKIGGKELKAAIEKLRDEMKKKHLVVTEAPNMDCKHIIHVKAADNLSEWGDVVVNCLNRAVQCKFASIAFPALGTGMSLKASEIAPVMIKAVRSFETRYGPSSLTDVRFVVYQDTMVNDFKKVIAEQTQRDGNSSTFKGATGATAASHKSGPKPKPGPTKMNKVTFVIYSLDKDSIKKAIKKLDACIDKEIHHQSFNDSIIKKMDDAQVRKVKDIASKYKLDVSLQVSTGNIVINGITSNVNSAANDIHRLLREVQTVENDKQSAALMASLVQWYYIEITDVGQSLEAYETDMNYRIENAYKNKNKNITFEADGKRFILDFTDMVEYPDGNEADKMSVIRRDLIKSGSFEAPPSWVDFNGNQKVVALPSTDNDYKTIEAKFLQSAGSGFTVTKIERIMNKTLWSQYQTKKKQLDDQNPQGTQNERQLWHGTAVEAVDNINAHGFNRSYCGKNATAFGDGVYFAVNASYSASNTYARPDSTGVKRMYICLVLTGEYTQGRSGMRVAPSKGSADKTALYDSVVNNVASPTMFIIFHDTQAYPEYLVTFKNK